MLLLGLLRRGGTEEGGCTESARLRGVRGLVCGRRLLRRASWAAKEAACLRRWLRCRCSAEETSCGSCGCGGGRGSWLGSQCATKQAATESSTACRLCCARCSTGGSSSQTAKQAACRRSRRGCRLVAEQRSECGRRCWSCTRSRLCASNIAEQRHVDGAVARCCQKLGGRVVLPRTSYNDA